MSKESTKDADLSCEQRSYKQELEQRRKKIKTIGLFKKDDGEYIRDDLDKATILDVWFLKMCDDCPEVREKLKFYYDCVKDGRYIDIAKKIIDDVDRFNSELTRTLGLKYVNSLLYRRLFFYIGNKKSPYLRGEQDRVAQILSEEWFLWNIFTQTFALDKAHPFIKESLIFPEFGLLGDVDRTDELISKTHNLWRTFGAKVRVAKINSDHNLSATIESQSLLSFKDSSCKVRIKDFFRDLTSLSESISLSLSQIYNSRLAIVLSSFWNTYSNYYEINEGDLSTDDREWWELVKENITEPIRSAFKDVEKNSEIFNDEGPIRCRSLLRMTSKIKEKANYIYESPLRRLLYSEPDCLNRRSAVYKPINLDQLVLFINPFDESEMNSYLWERRSLREIVKGLGLKVHKSLAIFPGSFLIVPQGMFLFVNLLSVFMNDRIFSDAEKNNKKILLGEVIPIISYGTGCFVFFENFQLPRYYEGRRNREDIKRTLLDSIFLKKWC